MPITMRAYMHYDVRPSEEWTCNLEFDFDGSLEDIVVTDTALNFAAGLSDLLLNNVLIDRITVSTWEKDSAPYDPATVKVIPIGIFGSNPFILTSPVDDDLVLFIRKTVSVGRAGKVLLRGALIVGEISSTSGSWTLNGTGTTRLQDAVASFWEFLENSGLSVALVGAPLVSTTYPAVAEGVKQIPIKNYAPTPIVRLVTNMVMVGVTERQDTQ